MGRREGDTRNVFARKIRSEGREAEETVGGDGPRNEQWSHGTFWDGGQVTGDESERLSTFFRARAIAEEGGTTEE